MSKTATAKRLKKKGQPRLRNTTHRVHGKDYTFANPITWRQARNLVLADVVGNDSAESPEVTYAVEAFKSQLRVARAA